MTIGSDDPDLEHEIARQLSQKLNRLR
jgi:hypothetical protein